MPGGRPTKFTKETRAAIILGLELAMTHRLAAHYAGVSEAILEQWMAEGRSGEDPAKVQFLEDTRKAKGRVAGRCLGTVLTHAQTHWQAAAWTLERRFDYTRNLKAEIAGPGGGPLRLDVDLTTLSVEQLRALAGDGSDDTP